MVFWKIAMVGVAIVVFMGVAKEKHWAQRAGVTGQCYAVAAPASNPTGAWYACKQGILTSFPSLDASACQDMGLAQHEEVWRCEAALQELPSY
jgi:hypothetical protein